MNFQAFVKIFSVKNSTCHTNFNSNLATLFFIITFFIGLTDIITDYIYMDSNMVLFQIKLK